MAKRLLGKEVNQDLNDKIKKNVEKLQKKGIAPKLAIIRVGDNPGDISYEKGAGTWSVVRESFTAS